MVIEEFKFSEKVIELEKREEISSSYKVKSYSEKMEVMKSKEIPYFSYIFHSYTKFPQSHILS